MLDDQSTADISSRVPNEQLDGPQEPLENKKSLAGASEGSDGTVWTLDSKLFSLSLEVPGKLKQRGTLSRHSPSEIQEPRQSVGNEYQGDASQIRTKRLRREVEVVMELEGEGYKIGFANTESGMKICLTVPHQLLAEESDIVADVKFVATASDEYPFKPPELTCHTKFTFPSLTDGRDLFGAVCKGDWSPSYTFLSIFRQLPQFINSLVIASKRLGATALSIGSFDGIVDLDQYLRDPSTSVIPFREPSDGTGNRPPRFVVMTEGAFLTVMACPGGASRQVEVMDWNYLADLTSCTKIKGCHLTLKFTAVGKPVQEYNLLVEGVDSLLQDIRSHVSSLGVKTFATTSEIDEMKNLSIDLAVRTSMLEDESFPLTLPFVQELMELYQRRIEILAARNDPAYGSTVEQIRTMLMDPRVSSALDAACKHDSFLPTKSSSSDVFNSEDHRPPREHPIGCNDSSPVNPTRVPLVAAADSDAEGDSSASASKVDTVPPLVELPPSSPESDGEGHQEPLSAGQYPTEEPESHE